MPLFAGLKRYRSRISRRTPPAVPLTSGTRNTPGSPAPFEQFGIADGIETFPANPAEFIRLENTRPLSQPGRHVAISGGKIGNVGGSLHKRQACIMEGHSPMITFHGNNGQGSPDMAVKETG